MNPNCSIIVLNYFGEKVLSNTIDSLLDLDYPKEKFEIIIVDNNSHDKSKEMIEKYAKYEKNIRYLFLNKNKGFAGGNNEGIKKAKSDYIILLNNDCVVDKNWLRELVKTATKDPKIFAVSSKIKLYPKYYYLKFNFLSSLFLMNAYLDNSYLSEIEKPKKLLLSVLNRDRYLLLEIPFTFEDKEISVKFNFEIGKQDSSKSFIELMKILNDEAVINRYKTIVNKNRLFLEITLCTDKFHKTDILERIQNAGIVVFQDGAGRDLGAKIIEQRQYYEYDYGQYSQEREIYAACGAAVLYNKRLLDKVGYLDELFFMYYEDVEISERARLRGYKIYYSPNAEVRHLHAFSSREWSNFFIYQAEKGRLLHVFFAFPFRIFIKEYITLILRIGEVGLRIIKGLSDRRRVLKFIKNVVFYAYKSSDDEINNKTDFGKVVQFIKIIFYFSLKLPILLIKRHAKHRFIPDKAINDNYQEILEGKWYF